MGRVGGRPWVGKDVEDTGTGAGTGLIEHCLRTLSLYERGSFL